MDKPEEAATFTVLARFTSREGTWTAEVLDAEPGPGSSVRVLPTATDTSAVGATFDEARERLAGLIARQLVADGLFPARFTAVGIVAFPPPIKTFLIPSLMEAPSR